MRLYCQHTYVLLFPFITFPIKIDNPGGAVRRVLLHGFCDLDKTLLVAFPRWGDWRIGRRILFHFVNWLRNNSLIYWSILPKSPSPPPNSIAPKTIESRSPCALHSSLVSSHRPSIKAALFLLIVAFFTTFCSRLRPQHNLIFIYFLASFAAAELQNASPHTFLRNRAPPPCPSHSWHRNLVGCCVPLFNGGHLRPWPHPLSLNFCRYNSTT